jgi:hypothetical protein
MHVSSSLTAAMVAHMRAVSQHRLLLVAPIVVITLAHFGTAAPRPPSCARVLTSPVALAVVDMNMMCARPLPRSRARAAADRLPRPQRARGDVRAKPRADGADPTACIRAHVPRGRARRGRDVRRPPREPRRVREVCLAGGLPCAGHMLRRGPRHSTNGIITRILVFTLGTNLLTWYARCALRPLGLTSGPSLCALSILILVRPPNHFAP